MRKFKLLYVNIVLGIVICFVGILLYSNTLNASFQFDDYKNITTNSIIRSFSSLPTLQDSQYYVLRRFVKRITVYYSFALNYYFHQDNVFGYHLVNLVIHIFSALLVWWFAFLLLNYSPRNLYQLEYKDQDKRIISFMTAMLFLTHPIQTQAVTYISQRFTSMAAMFYLLSVCLYMKGRIVILSPRKTRVAILYFLGAALSAILGMFTKEIVFTLPFCIILIECFFFKKKGTRGKGFWWAMLFILLFALIIPGLYQFNISYIFRLRAVVLGSKITSTIYFLTQFRVIVTYIRLLFLPIGQNIDYDFPLSYSFFEWPVLLSLIALLSIMFFAVKVRSRYRLISFGIFWFFLTISISSSFIPIKDVICEHRLYLPSVGFFLAFCIGLHHILKDSKKFTATLCVIILILSFLTFKRNKVWKTGITLWQDTVLKSPNKVRPYHNLGFAYLRQGSLDLAIENFTKAIEMNPLKHTRVYNNLALAYKRKGQYYKALDNYNKSIALNQTPVSYYDRGILLAEMYQYDKALKDLNTALEGYRLREKNLIHPDLHGRYSNYLDLYAKAYFAKGNIYKIKGDYSKAITNYNMALKFDPLLEKVYHNRGNIHAVEGRYDKALADYNKALDIEPLMQTYYERGRLYNKIKQYDLALNDFNKAIDISSGYADIYRERAIVHRNLGNIEQSEKDEEQANILDKK